MREDIFTWVLVVIIALYFNAFLGGVFYGYGHVRFDCKWSGIGELYNTPAKKTFFTYGIGYTFGFWFFGGSFESLEDDSYRGNNDDKSSACD